jgi:hypothetical protein
VNHPEVAQPRVKGKQNDEREKVKVGRKTMTPTKNKCSRIEVKTWD